MIDTKAKNFILDNKGAMNCCDCGATPTDVREDRTAKFEKANPEAMNYGGTTLHFGNRGLENLLKMSSQMPLKTYKAYEVNKDILDKRMQEICDKLAKHHVNKSFMVLPKCPLAASTGHLARTALSDCEFLAEVTDLPLEFIKGVKDIWIQIRSEEFI